MSKKPSPASNDGPFIRKVIIVLALAALALILWQLRDVFLLLFGAIVFAVVFHALADPIARRTGMPEWTAVTCAITIIVAALALAFWLLGAEVSAQLRNLADRLPAAWRSFELRLGGLELSGPLDKWLRNLAPSAGVPSAGDLAIALGISLANLLLVFIGGIYLALQPTLYRLGTVKLVPREHRALADEALVDSGRVLKLWLKGQLLAMLLVGTLTGLGLWLLGIPSALALGLLAGLLEFIPYLGPIVSAIPGLLLALTSGIDLALWTLALYTAVQQIEGNIIQPLVQRYAVHIPPALLLFSLIGVGILFGTIGLFLAAPLTVVGYVLIKRLYIQEALHTATDIPGSP